MNFRRLLSTIQVSKKFMDFKLREFSLSTVQLRKEDPFNRNPRDPVSWASTKSIPLPHGQTLVDTSDVRPGTEKWHEPVSQPYSQTEKFKWPTYNDRIHSPDGTFRPAYVCHMRTKIKYSPDKMWYIAAFIRGMSVDEALKQLKFINKKGARVVEEVVQEARDMAIKEHHFEYPTNMWVAESFAEDFDRIKSIRRHARMKIGVMRYRYISYFLKLEEGEPPLHYHPDEAPKTSEQFLEEYLQDHRNKNIRKW